MLSAERSCLFFFSKKDNVCDFLVSFLGDEVLSKRGSTVEGKKLLLHEQILSCNS